MSRTTFTVDEGLGDRIREYKRSDETTDEFFERIEALLSDGEFNPNSDVPDDVLTADHIPDIANAASRQTARDIEETLRR
ncbi:hypothetical protein [Haloferax volcanii]|uniref:hypothetical protein n=1 Tax=Haloferax volcanii TaxID=2246 RepID=UPI00249CB457|nr:hypothetical protein [Haloferax alexandrinus]WEL29869.1 hypothetical protein HBNXHx_1763 [Haloferax alexandrinus]